jgi:hypothetical protein
MKQLFWRSCFAIASLCTVDSALACEVERIASPAEITRAAESIVRVRAKRHVPSADPRKFDPGRVEMVVLEILKGSLQGEELELPGYVEDYGGPNDEESPYRRVRPGGRRGDCYASDYRLGREYLLFLKGGSPRWSPLAATNEEVSGSTDPWVVWAREEIKQYRAKP